MNILYLWEGGNGAGNVILNIILILAWIIVTNEYDKLIVLTSREDSITNFCNIINNERIEITNVCHNFQMTSSNTVKAFLKDNFYSKIEKDVKKAIVDDKSSFPYIFFYGNTRLSTNILLNIKKYFNPQPNEELQKIINSLKKEKYIAVHVRGTDFISDILKTTEDKISYEKYYKFIDSSEHKYVYLATDDIIIKEKFIKRYGDKIFCYDSFCDNIQLGHNVRNTYPISIYVDMFMCRGAYSFLGTHKSTFSEFIHILKIFM